MIFYYCETGMVTNMGHFANQCRYIVGELQRRGVATRVLAPQQIQASLGRELAVMPLFQVPISLSWRLDQDEYCGVVNSFFMASKITADDLAPLQAASEDDVIYVNTTRPYMLMAVIRFTHRHFTPANCPTVIFELGFPPGLFFGYRQSKEDNANISPSWHVTNGDPMLYRLAMGHFNPHFTGCFHFLCSGQEMAQAYSQCLNRPVGVLPMPHTRLIAPRNRRGSRPVTIGFMGMQRVEKGFAMVPEIISQVLAQRPDVRFLVHDGSPGKSGFALEKKLLRQMAQHDARITLKMAGESVQEWLEDIQQIDLNQWAALWSQIDLTVLPYNAIHYAHTSSGVCAESIANAVPLVVPYPSALSAQLAEFDTPGIHFQGGGVAKVVEGVLTALDQFDDLAERAYHASLLWEKRSGAAPFVSRLLECHDNRGKPPRGQGD